MFQIRAGYAYEDGITSYETRVNAFTVVMGGFTFEVPIKKGSANTFGLAFLMRRWLKPSWFPILIVVAVIQSFSRIHLGVHYPLDLLAGALWGILISTILVRIDSQFS